MYLNSFQLFEKYIYMKPIIFWHQICETFSHYFAQWATYVIPSFHFALISSDDFSFPGIFTIMEDIALANKIKCKE